MADETSTRSPNMNRWELDDTAYLNKLPDPEDYVDFFMFMLANDIKRSGARLPDQYEPPKTFPVLGPWKPGPATATFAPYEGFRQLPIEDRRVNDRSVIPTEEMIGKVDLPRAHMNIESVSPYGSIEDIIKGAMDSPPSVLSRQLGYGQIKVPPAQNALSRLVAQSMNAPVPFDERFPSEIEMLANAPPNLTPEQLIESKLSNEED